MLRDELHTALDEYVGFPPDEVPRWVDWDIALGELLTVIDKYCWLKDERELPPHILEIIEGDLIRLECGETSRQWVLINLAYQIKEANYKPVKPVLEKK